ncbi:MAG: hypothetical protein V1851_00410 [Patescibacteria group bacterium]
MFGNFGDIYWIPANKHPKLSMHWVVLLCIDKKNKLVFYQSLSSRVYKVFPNFGSFTNTYCPHCSINSNIKSFKKYLTKKSSYIDIDNVIFLNFNKFNFLNKETYIPLNTIEKDFYFDFKQKVLKNTYKYYGNLARNNAQSSIIALRTSKRLSEQEVISMVNFYKNTIT